MDTESTETLETQALSLANKPEQAPSARLKGQLGLSRWVQFAFFALGVVVFWTFDRLITVVWDKFQEPPELVISAIAALLAALVCWVLYQNKQVFAFSSEVVSELEKVTWPSRDETRASTVVVIVASIIAALILGGFDALWSALTDVIYKV